MQGSVINGSNFDKFASERYIDQHGFPKVLPLPLGAWTRGTGVPLAAAGANIVGVGAVATSLAGIIWDSAAATTEVIRCSIALPGDFRAQYPFISQANVPSEHPESRRRSKLILRAKARKRDADASDADDINLRAQVYMQHPSYAAATDRDEEDGSALQSLATPVSNLLDPTVAAATVAAFRYYEFDLTEAMTEAQRNALQPGSTFQMTLGLDAVPGTADFVEIVATELWYSGHLTLPRKIDRGEMA